MVEGKKLGLVGRCLLGAGLALSCASCESPEGNMALATLGNMTQASPRTSYNDKVLGVGASTLGQMGYQMNVAREGKTEVNVNVGESVNVSTPVRRERYDMIHLINGNYIEGEIIAEKPSELVVDIGERVLVIPKEKILEFEYRR